MNHNITEHYSGKIQNVSIMEWNHGHRKIRRFCRNVAEFHRICKNIPGNIHQSIGVHLFSLFN